MLQIPFKDHVIGLGGDDLIPLQTVLELLPGVLVLRLIHENAVEGTLPVSLSHQTASVQDPDHRPVLPADAVFDFPVGASAELLPNLSPRTLQILGQNHSGQLAVKAVTHLLTGIAGQAQKSLAVLQKTQLRAIVAADDGPGQIQRQQVGPRAPSVCGTPLRSGGRGLRLYRGMHVQKPHLIFNTEAQRGNPQCRCPAGGVFPPHCGRSRHQTQPLTQGRWDQLHPVHIQPRPSVQGLQAVFSGPVRAFRQRSPARPQTRVLHISAHFPLHKLQRGAFQFHRHGALSFPFHVGPRVARAFPSGSLQFIFIIPHLAEKAKDNPAFSAQGPHPRRRPLLPPSPGF